MNAWELSTLGARMYRWESSGEIVSRVYWGRECVGTFYTRGQDVSVGKFRLTARSPVKAMLGIIDEHQRGQRLIHRQAAAFGVPA